MDSRVPGIWQHLHATPHRLHWVDAGGVATRVLEAGPPDAPPVLMLHGTAGSLENFCANIGAFAARHRVLAIDLLGCGLTDKPAYDYRIADYAGHALAVMDALQVQQAAVIGVSLGSWVAVAMATAAPARVSQLVMVAPAGIVVDAEEEARVAEGVRRRRSAAAQEPTWESVFAAMKGLVLDPACLSEDLIALRLAIYRDPRMKDAMPRLLAFTQGGQALSEAQWRALTQPMLVIAAVDAPNMFLANARAIAGLVPQARLLEMRGCDHWAQYEQADAFNAAVMDFLQDAGQGADAPPRPEHAP